MSVSLVLNQHAELIARLGKSFQLSAAAVTRLMSTSNDFRLDDGVGDEMGDSPGRQGVNVTAMDRTLRNKSVFSFLRQLTMWHCSQLLLRAARLLLTAGPLVVQQSIDISPGRRALQQQMRSSDVGGRIAGQTDRRTDTNGRTDARQLHRPCSA